MVVRTVVNLHHLSSGQMKGKIVRDLFVTMFSVTLMASVSAAERAPQPSRTAAQVDQLILQSEETASLSLVDDAAFLRRVTLDVAGRPATPAEITRFGLNPSQNKRSAIVDELLESSEYGENWARYWRDAMLLRATNVRSGLVRQPFEDWMAERLNDNQSWETIVQELLTATGTVRENGATALLFAHEGEPEEVAAEASRLFMGIQVQCANCHDHPWDRWKREEFHELVAFFPRVSVRRDRSTDDRTAYIVASVDRDQRRRRGVSEFLLKRLDRNDDQIITKQEAARTPLQRLFNNERAMERVDRDGDGRLTIEEIRTAEPASNNRPGQGSTEHFMPDLDNPASEGTQVDPVFFLGDRTIDTGANDLDRRQAVAEFITSHRNEWFARAIVNRMWAELTGTAFYEPIDDLGPDREASHAKALEVLCEGFVSSGYDLKWLVRTILATQIYQRDINTGVDGFAYMEPERLRSDQLYAVLCQSLGVDGLQLPVENRRRYGRGDPGRGAIAATFGFDPSTLRDEVAGTIPQALFLMNSPQLNQLIRADDARSPIARILQAVSDDDDAVRELYLAVLGRLPSKGELAVCQEYLAEAPTTEEGMEDVLWALLNSSEFQTKR